MRPSGLVYKVQIKKADEKKWYHPGEVYTSSDDNPFGWVADVTVDTREKGVTRMKIILFDDAEVIEKIDGMNPKKPIIISVKEKKQWTSNISQMALTQPVNSPQTKEIPSQVLPTVSLQTSMTQPSVEKSHSTKQESKQTSRTLKRSATELRSNPQKSTKMTKSSSSPAKTSGQSLETKLKTSSASAKSKKTAKQKASASVQSKTRVSPTISITTKVVPEKKQGTKKAKKSGV